MPVETRMWEIDGNELRPAESSKLEKEELLQTWLEEDISILDDDLLVIEREVTTDLGDRIDLLAIDPVGQLVVIELKRGDTPRKVVAQVLGYTAWVSELSYEDIDNMTRRNLDTDLASAFEESFDEELPDIINESQRMIVVAAGVDLYVERSLRYLSEEYGVDINAVFFRCFENADGDQWLVRTWLEEPSEVERRKKSSSKWTARTTDQLREIAEGRGAREEFDMMLEHADRWDLRKWHAKNRLPLHGRFPNGKWRKVLGIRPKESKPDRVCVYIPADRVVGYFALDEDEFKAMMPDPYEGSKYLLSATEIERLAEFIDGHRD